jgi:predicted nucleic acid-binding protein
VAETYALDSNVYIRAQRSPERMAALRRFSLRAGLRVRMHAVVAMELRAGTRSERQAREVRDLFDAYAERDRVIVPTAAAYLEAGRVLAALRSAGYGGAAQAPELCNDAVLAASCREDGSLLVTSDYSDFAAIQKHLRGFRFAEAAEVGL